MNYRIRFHPLVARDLDAIVLWILDYAGPLAASRKLAEIAEAIATLKATPHKESMKSLLDCVPSQQREKPLLPSLLTMPQPKF